MTTIGDNVRRLRKLRGLNQTELARRAEITQYAVSGIETGAHHPQTRTTRRLAAALDVRVSDLFEGVEEAPGKDKPSLLTLLAQQRGRELRPTEPIDWSRVGQVPIPPELRRTLERVEAGETTAEEAAPSVVEAVLSMLGSPGEAGEAG